MHGRGLDQTGIEDARAACHAGRRPAQAAPFWAAAAAATAVACSVSTGDLPRSGTCDPFEVTGSYPADGSAGIATDVVSSFRFNDFPDPDTVGSSSMSLWTGVYYHTGDFSVSLVDRSVGFRPTSALASDRLYTLRLLPTIMSLRGCELGPPPAPPGPWAMPAYLVSFRTAVPTSVNGEDQPVRPVPRPVSFSDVTALFARDCSGAGCHVEDAAAAGADVGAASQLGLDCPPIPASGLSLCARDAHQQLIGIGAAEVPRLIRVTPHDSARSYLLRKLVGAPPVMGHQGTPVFGQPGISLDDLHLLESWIDTGAPST
jgi:hypothetical protein